MRAFLARARSALSLLLVLLWMGIPCALWLYLLILRLARLLPSRRTALVAAFVERMRNLIVQRLGELRARDARV